MARPMKFEPGQRAIVRCLWDNVWTTEGKIRKGEETNLTPEEAQRLDDMDAVKITGKIDA